MWLFHFHNFVTVRVRAENLEQNPVDFLVSHWKELTSIWWPDPSMCSRCFNNLSLEAVPSPPPISAESATEYVESVMSRAFNEEEVLKLLSQHY
jgi:hypothetical protein